MNLMPSLQWKRTADEPPTNEEAKYLVGNQPSVKDACWTACIKNAKTWKYYCELPEILPPERTSKLIDYLKDVKSGYLCGGVDERADGANTLLREMLLKAKRGDFDE